MRKHGKSKTAEYYIWSGIKTRCTNRKRRDFPHYGGRGIRMCNRWSHGEGGRTGFECFIADMGERPSSRHSVERHDNDGNYEPDNCFWATLIEQRRNTRAVLRIEHGGMTLTTTQWSEKTGISSVEIARRISRGWSIARALSQPPKRQPKRCK